LFKYLSLKNEILAFEKKFLARKKLAGKFGGKFLAGKFWRENFSGGKKFWREN
jgi:hypothetical protein